MTSDNHTPKGAPEGTLVSLVGAGPGDPSLLTLGAIRCLGSADAVFYDALVNPIILSYCRPGIERIPVGKRCGRHSHEQWRINDLLVERALRGGHIVRLKGGDPFVFGRGGEEVLALREHGIPFEIVPGITAGNSVTTYSGIPVTHRGTSRCVTFITASTKEHKIDATSWRSLVELGGTVVFYMGTTVIPELCRLLMASGMSPETPACVTTDGTLPSQRRLIARVGDFTPDFTDYSKLSPGLFIVGDVVGFADDFSFFAPTPLSQVKVLAVSVDTERSGLTDVLGDKVAYIHTLPTSANAINPYTPDIEALLSGIKEGAWFAFTTTAAIDYTVEMLLRSGRDLRALAACKIAAIGKTTASRLRSYGLMPDYIPERRDLQGFTESLSLYLSGQKVQVVVPHNEDERNEESIRYMQSKGLDVVPLPLYHNEEITYTADDVTFLRDIVFTHVTFSSTKAVDNFFALASRYDLRSIMDGAKVIALGEATTARLASYGIVPYCTLPKATIRDVADAIISAP